MKVKILSCLLFVFIAFSIPEAFASSDRQGKLKAVKILDKGDYLQVHLKFNHRYPARARRILYNKNRLTIFLPVQQSRAELANIVTFPSSSRPRQLKKINLNHLDQGGVKLILSMDYSIIKVAKGIKSSINGNTLICTIPYYNSFTAHKSNNGRTAPADYERKDAEESDRVVYAGNSNDKPNRQPHKKNKNRAELNKIREIILGGDEQEEKVKNLKPVVEDQHAPNGQDDLVEDQEGARLLAALYPSTGNPAVKAPKIKVKKDAFTPMKMPLALVITIACFFAFMALYKYFQKKGSPTLTDTESIEIISRRNLGNKQQLALVKVMGDTLLISSGDQGISLLSRIGINGDDDKVSQFLQKDNVSLEGPFAQQLKRAKNELVQKQRPIDSMVDSINDKIRQLQSI